MDEISVGSLDDEGLLEDSHIDDPQTLGDLLYLLEKGVSEKCGKSHPHLVTYIEEIKLKLEKGDEIAILKLIDELEELLDIALFSQ